MASVNIEKSVGSLAVPAGLAGSGSAFSWLLESTTSAS